MRLSPDVRGAFGKLVKKGLTVTRLAELFDTTRQTVHRWLKRARHVGREYFKDKPRQPRLAKVTEQVELSILKLRTTFKWGTARIQQGLCNLPGFIKDSVRCIQGVELSRETVNNVLARNNQNGYQHEFKRWKFFRAKCPDELWQIDFKGPFTVGGKRYWFLVCIDDYSRFIVCAEQFDRELTTAQTVAVLEKQKRLPKAILSDHGSQFKEQWKNWCNMHGVEAHFAHPSYPQDKGKVERCIQNLNREFVNHLRKFPQWLKGKLLEYKEWFNHSRFHRGVKAFPIDLYECNVRNLT
ncbi:MAG TPA: DDE-type integrase/transposase/recombinase [Candidatus Bathyarchaeia archaeon]